MQTAANISRFLTGVFSYSKVADRLEVVSKAGFYQQFALELIKGFRKSEALGKLGDRLVALAEQAHLLRRLDALERVSCALVNLPLSRKYETIGRYYEALRLQRFGCGNVEQARRLLEHVAEEASLFYRLRAMQSLAANFRHKGDYRTALSLYHEADRISACNRFYDPYTIVGTRRMVAVINSLEGNHQDALAVLENLFPIAHSMRRANPQVYYDYLNSFAVELTQAGRLQEAEQACRITLASPFASAYPEWRETWQDVLSRGYRTARSFVSLNCRTLNVGNVLLLPLAQRSDSTHSENFTLSPFYQQASVTSLQEWKRKMVKEPNGDNNDKMASEDLDKMSNKELLVEILQRTSKKDMSEKKLRKILEYVIKVESQSED